jgi:hypothetical protein
LAEQFSQVCLPNGDRKYLRQVNLFSALQLGQIIDIPYNDQRLSAAL